jgi:serine/threonine protein kinase
MVGEVLGNYRVISELTSGGMGTLYRAQHELLGRSAAVKLLRPELTANEELLQRFYNEAKAATSIRHPGIVEVYDFGYTGDGRAYIVMELLDGEPLGERLRRRGRLTEVEAENIGRQIAGALRAAHASGIVHRDLKPDNVFLVPDPDGRSERVKVLDFGVAKLTDVVGGARQTQTGALMGTPLYMAPEQARAAGAIDHRADLYSLGCMLYEMLVGRPPFVAEGAGEIIALQMFAPPEPPRNLLTALTPELDAIVLRLLEKEPHDRYQDALEVQTALEGIRGTLSSSRAEEVVRESRRFTLSMAQGPTQQRTIPVVPPPAPTRSAMPIIAGLVTVAVAAAAVIFVLTRTSAPPAKPVAAPTEPAAPPVVKAVVEPRPVATPADAVVTVPAPVEVTPVPRKDPKPRPKPRTARPKGACVTGNGSPCEETL